VHVGTFSQGFEIEFSQNRTIRLVGEVASHPEEARIGWMLRNGLREFLESDFCSPTLIDRKGFVRNTRSDETVVGVFERPAEVEADADNKYRNAGPGRVEGRSAVAHRG